MVDERLGNHFPDFLPTRHLFEFSPYRCVIQQEQQKEQDAGVRRPSVDLLDVDLSHLRQESFHIVRYVD